MQLKYFIQKYYYRFYKYIIAGKSKKYFYKGIKTPPTRIIFYLCDNRIVHLGDSLWFEPLIKFLSSYFTVSVYPIEAMEFYFKQLSYTIATENDIDNDCLLIAPIELMYKLRRFKSVLYLNFDYSLIAHNDKLINSMINALANFFALDTNQINAKYQELKYTSIQINDVVKKMSLQQNKTYIIFNDYIDSWGKYTTLEMIVHHKKILVNYAKNLKLIYPNYQFVYVGSKQDKAMDNNHCYEFIDIDLRGITTIENLFILTCSPQIVAYIGFDTFLLHLFNMYNKLNYILLKPGNTPRINQFIVDGVLVPYKDDQQCKKLVQIFEDQKICIKKS